MLQFRLMTEKYKYRIDIVAHCSNPDSGRPAVGYSYLRDRPVRTDELQGAIQNARDRLKYCPPCKVDCQVKRLAASTPAQLIENLFPELEG